MFSDFVPGRLEGSSRLDYWNDMEVLYHPYYAYEEVLAPFGGHSPSPDIFLHGRGAISLQWLLASVERTLTGTVDPFRISRIAAAAAETMIGAQIEIRSNRVLAPLKDGKSGLLTRAGGLLSGPVPLLLRLRSVLPMRRPSRTTPMGPALVLAVLVLGSSVGAVHASAHASGRASAIAFS